MAVTAVEQKQQPSCVPGTVAQHPFVERRRIRIAQHLAAEVHSDLKALECISTN